MFQKGIQAKNTVHDHDSHHGVKSVLNLLTIP